ncbi:uncharacterized protein LOC121727355 [Aricia agestis]|uniref:uncharacterized protein LOC121727355 n=1 Tax=Aricia agestis TaxID=91739 RepID=UPI001C2069CD|nr:uncharacterized protein LOC121727355 [Aricia agestis]
MTKSRPQVEFVNIEVHNLAASINEESSENTEVKEEVEGVEDSEEIDEIEDKEINQPPNEINEFGYYEPEPVTSGHTAEEETEQFDSEIPENENSNICEPAAPVYESQLLTNELQSLGRPKRGRKPKYGGPSREERKKLKYSNLSYVNSRKKIISPKKFINFKCSCSKRCHDKVSVEQRLAQFEKFYSLGSYIAQNIYLTTVIKEQPVKRHYAAKNKESKGSKKNYSRQYLLDNVSVCKDMFINTLQTSGQRINTSLSKMRSDRCITDNRGVHGGYNKASL